jgi:hypothetical protein
MATFPHLPHLPQREEWPKRSPNLALGVLSAKAKRPQGSQVPVVSLGRKEKAPTQAKARVKALPLAIKMPNS